MSNLYTWDEDKKLTWRDVFDSEKRHRRWGHISECAEFALEVANYEYIAWNGRIYALRYAELWPCPVEWQDTGLTIDDLED